MPANAVLRLFGFQRGDIPANPQILLNPQIASTLRQQFAAQGPQGEAIFNTLLGAIKVGLVGALHDVFLLGTMVAQIGLVTVLFLEERPLRPEDEPRLAPVVRKRAS